jgi:hypothetical protein
MTTLSTLASAILPLLTAPLTVTGVSRALPRATPEHVVGAALDELINAVLVACDEHEGAAYYYRRDEEAEKATAIKWEMKRRAAEKARNDAWAAAERAYIVAMDAADAERDAADPMAAIKVGVAS